MLLHFISNSSPIFAEAWTQQKSEVVWAKVDTYLHKSLVPAVNSNHKCKFKNVMFCIYVLSILYVHYMYYCKFANHSVPDCCLIFHAPALFSYIHLCMFDLSFNDVLCIFTPLTEKTVTWQKPQPSRIRSASDSLPHPRPLLLLDSLPSSAPETLDINICTMWSHHDCNDRLLLRWFLGIKEIRPDSSKDKGMVHTYIWWSDAWQIQFRQCLRFQFWHLWKNRITATSHQRALSVRRLHFWGAIFPPVSCTVPERYSVQTWLLLSLME